jgi:threonine dehydratase
MQYFLLDKNTRRSREQGFARPEGKKLSLSARHTATNSLPILPLGDSRLEVVSAEVLGQALAYAGRKRHRNVIVFASSTANPVKLELMRKLGADLRISGEDFDAAKAAAKQFAVAEHAWMVEDGQEPEISEGAGSLALELLTRNPAFDHILLPLGNGALLNG